MKSIADLCQQQISSEFVRIPFGNAVAVLENFNSQGNTGILIVKCKSVYGLRHGVCVSALEIGGPRDKFLKVSSDHSVLGGITRFRQSWFRQRIRSQRIQKPAEWGV